MAPLHSSLEIERLRLKKKKKKKKKGGWRVQEKISKMKRIKCKEICWRRGIDLKVLRWE